MSTKFNGGKGGAVCNGCGGMVVDGMKVLHPHLVLNMNNGPRHYCNEGCIDQDLRENKGMHRKLTVLLARESAARHLMTALQQHLASLNQGLQMREVSK